MKLFRLTPALLLCELLAATILFAFAAPCGATTATLNLRTGSAGSLGNPAFGHLKAFTSQEVTIDFADRASLKLDSWTTTTAGSYVELFNMPPGSKVIDLTAKVITAQGATCTAKIGDGADDDGYLAALNLNSVGYASSFNATTTPAYGAGKTFTAAGVIGMKLGHDTSKAKLKLKVVYENLN